MVIGVVFYIQYSKAQCDEEIISTFPPTTNTGDQRGNLPTRNKNPERPDLRNTFNWMIDDPITGLTECEFIGPPYSSLNSGIPNPFAQNFFPLKPSTNNLADADFHPEDGWELLYRGFGRGTDNLPLPVSYRPQVPYLILYNKFESTLRVFTMADMVGYDVANIVLKFAPDFSESINLSNNTAHAQALDQYTVIDELASSSTHPNTYSRWFYADFKIAYDPCVCYFDSRFDVNIEFVETSDIKLYGRFVGTNTPIDYLNGGQTSAALDPNFLSSMDYRYMNSEVEAGSIIYKNVNLLTADYDKRMKDYKNEKRHAEQMKAWSTALTVGAYIATAGKPLLAKKMGALIWNGSNIAADKGKKLVEGIIYSGNAVGKYTDYYAGRLKEEAKMPGMPSVIQGEMNLRGTLTDYDRKLLTKIGNPGSLQTNTFDDENSPKYPFYNEQLGVFALFEQPKVQIYYKFTDQVQRLNMHGDQFPIEKITDRHHVALRLENDIKYRINPATDPNMENTKVLFSLRMKHQIPNNAKYNDNLNWEIRRVVDLPQGKELYYQTPYLPASCFEKLITSVDFTSISTNSIDDEPAISRGRHVIMPSDLELSVMVVLESNEIGKNGEPNRAVHMFTYPVESSLLTGEGYSYNEFLIGYNKYRYTISAQYEDELNYNSKTLQSTNSIHAQNQITFSNGYMDVAGGNTSYEAGKSILISGEYVISSTGGDVVFKIFDLEDTPPPCTYDNTGHILDKDDVERFCSPHRDGKYKGHVSKTKKGLGDTPKLKKNSEKIDFRIFPNPTLQYINIVSSESNFDNITIYDMNGKVVYENNETNKEPSQLKIDVSDLSEGLYFVKASSTRGIMVNKFIKTRK